MNNQRTRSIIIVLAALAVTVIVFALVIYVPRIGKAEIEVVVVPDDSTLTMDDKPIKQGKLWVESGTHIFKATRQYFGDASVTIDTKTHQTGRAVYVIPNPNTPEARQWLLDHPDQSKILEIPAGIKQDDYTTNLQQNFPIVHMLPKETLNYKIDSPDGIDENGKLMLHIRLYAQLNNGNQMARYKAQLLQDQAEALQFLTSNGVDVNTLSITYTPNP